MSNNPDDPAQQSSEGDLSHRQFERDTLSSQGNVLPLDAARNEIGGNNRLLFVRPRRQSRMRINQLMIGAVALRAAWRRRAAERLRNTSMCLPRN
jgi:hypothetical protein